MGRSAGRKPAHTPPKAPDGAWKISFSLGELHRELTLPREPQQDRTEWVKPPLGCPTDHEGVTGTSGRGSEHTWSHGSVLSAPRGMLSSHCTLCQEPNPALGRASLSPGTFLVAGSSLNKRSRNAGPEPELQAPVPSHCQPAPHGP